MLIHQGQVVDQFVGAQPESAIKAMLDRHLAPATDEPQIAGRGQDERPEDAALRLLEQRDAAGAATAIEALAATNAEHPALRALRARLAFVATANASPDAAGLRATLESDPASSAARHALAAHHAAAGDFATALAEWLELMRRDRKFADEAGRRSLLQVFDVLGDQDPLVVQYRRRMASLLH
jgi:putative thioredoxin